MRPDETAHVHVNERDFTLKQLSAAMDAYILAEVAFDGRPLDFDVGEPCECSACYVRSIHPHYADQVEDPTNARTEHTDCCTHYWDCKCFWCR